MNIQRIVKIGAGLLGVLGIVFLFRIIGAGDEEIKMAASMGDYGTVSPLISIAQIIFYVSVAATLIFSLLNLFGGFTKIKESFNFSWILGCSGRYFLRTFIWRNPLKRWRSTIRLWCTLGRNRNSRILFPFYHCNWSDGLLWG